VTHATIVRAATPRFSGPRIIVRARRRIIYFLTLRSNYEYGTGAQVGQIDSESRPLAGAPLALRVRSPPVVLDMQSTPEALGRRQLEALFHAYTGEKREATVGC
jgi:hypothetical protein